MRFVNIHIIVLLAALFLNVATFATGGMALFIKLKSVDDPEKYSFTVRPVLTFNGDSVFIQTDSVEINTGYKQGEVEKIYFEVVEEVIPSPNADIVPETDAINDLQEEVKQKTSFEFAYDGRAVQIKGLGEAPKVAVFNMSGVRMQPRMSITPKGVTFSVAELPAGIYVIRAGDRSIKIIKK